LEHADASSIEEARSLLAAYGEKAKVIAGGTDLLGLIKDRISGPKMPMPEVLINIGAIPELTVLRYDEARQSLRIGAAVTLTQLEESAIVREKFPLISQACSSVATPQIRNVGTVGGNLCQRPWCWYFRNSAFNCFKKGGEGCDAVTGEHQYYFSVNGLGVCVMSHPSDLAPALMALGAELEIASRSGSKRIALDRFFLGAREVHETILGPDEFIVAVNVPCPAVAARMAFVKNRIRDTWDFSLASAAVLLEMSGAVCTGSRIVVGGLAPFPYRALDAEEMLRNSRIDKDVATRTAQKAAGKAKGLRMNKYKLGLGAVVVRDAILAALAC
jgi:xanthine dehydrogenase YagS FAD-binding subunit